MGKFIAGFGALFVIVIALNIALIVGAAFLIKALVF